MLWGKVLRGAWSWIVCECNNQKASTYIVLRHNRRRPMLLEMKLNSLKFLIPMEIIRLAVLRKLTFSISLGNFVMRWVGWIFVMKILVLKIKIGKN